MINAKELHKLITDYAIEKGLSTNELLAFLTTTFVGTMEMIGDSQDFMDRTCDRMKLQFKEKEMEKINNDNRPPSKPSYYLLQSMHKETSGICIRY